MTTSHGAIDIGHEIPSDHPICKHLWMRREDLSRVDFDDEPDVENREACRDVFDTLEVEVLVPILYGVDLLGVIAVGRKLSGDRLAADDRLLLRTLANQSAIAIENAKAFDEIAKLNETLEARVDERTRELRETQLQLTQAEKMKSLGQLVAGVAHELNNPIGFVHANLQLLDEHINPEVARQLRKKGFDVLSVEEARMREASDEQVLSFAASEKRVIVTYNIRDFQMLLLDWHRAGRHHSGIVFVSEKTASQKTIGPLVRALKKLLDTAPRSRDWLNDKAYFSHVAANNIMIDLNSH